MGKMHKTECSEESAPKCLLVGSRLTKLLGARGKGELVRREVHDLLVPVTPTHPPHTFLLDCHGCL